MTQQQHQQIEALIKPLESYYCKGESGVVVLGVELLSQLCEITQRIQRKIIPNVKDQQVIVKGMSLDANKITEQIKDRSNKDVKIISPKLPEATETVLLLHLHCKGCARLVRELILEMAGNLDPNRLRIYTYKKAERLVGIVPPEKENDTDNKHPDYRSIM